MHAEWCIPKLHSAEVDYNNSFKTFLTIYHTKIKRDKKQYVNALPHSSFRPVSLKVLHIFGFKADRPFTVVSSNTILQGVRVRDIHGSQFLIKANTKCLITESSLSNKHVRFEYGRNYIAMLDSMHHTIFDRNISGFEVGYNIRYKCHSNQYLQGQKVT